MVPRSGASAPVMILISVDLPAPFSPTSAWTSPAASSNETPLSARTPANDFVIEVADSSTLGIAERRQPLLRRRPRRHAALAPRGAFAQ